MKKRILGIILALALFAGGMTTAVAAGVAKDIVAQLRPDFAIVIDGKVQSFADVNGNTVYPVLYNGTTYLPLRAIGGLMGKEVGWDGATKTATLNTPKVGGFDSTTVASQLKVIKEYTWDTSYYHYVAIVIKNTSNYTVSPRVQLSLKDSSGNVVGAKNQSEQAFGPGSEMAFVFSNDEDFASYNYVISANEEKYYSECVSSLDVKVTTTSQKAILEVTNNGTKAAQFVEYIALYLRNGKAVGYDRGYCVDDNSEIQPGATEMEESTSYETFDTVEVYLTGRASK